MSLTAGRPSFNLQDLKHAGDWDEQRLIAAMNHLYNFFVVDDATDEQSTHIQGQLDAGLDRSGLRVINFICTTMNNSGYQIPLLQSFLRLGADPDVLDSCGLAVSHGTSFYGWVMVANVISKCRPDVTMPQGTDQETPLCRALRRAAEVKDLHGRWDIALVAEVWRKLARHGPPSLAQLAHDKEWYAVHNLCRRRLISDDEKKKTYKGKTAIQWAMFHRREKISKEMAYLLELNSDGTQAAGGNTHHQQTNGEMEELKEMFLLTVSNSKHAQEEIENI